MAQDRVHFDDRIVKKFLWATLLWGLVGMLVGVIIAFQMFLPSLSLNLPWTTFGGLRPLHGHNAVAFFLTTPFLGLAYYFMPKAVGKPIYS
jgi:cytochrome c oxidase cbb3-type subunit I/II